MSQTAKSRIDELRSETTTQPANARESRHEARGRRDPCFGRRPCQEVLRRAGVEARRRLRRRRRVSGRAVHPSRLAELDPLRQGHHVSHARFGNRNLPRRVGHRSGARRTRRSRRRCERSVSPCGPGKPPVSGRDPERRSYSSFATFKDPDGNEWLLQEITSRFPGRVDTSDTTFTSSTELAAALRRASEAHGEHEKRNGGQRDENWPDWYAEYMVAEHTGKALPL